MQISIIIVSYNTKAITLDCLHALCSGLGDVAAEVFVVDNHSTDGTPEAIQKQFPEVRLIANAQNVGFGAANNQAMAMATGECFLLLNSDAFLKPGALPALRRYLDSHADTGVVGPRLLNADGSLQISCFRYPSPARAWLENLGISSLLRSNSRIGDYRRWAHDADREVDWVIGACMLVRREVYEQVGGFDERFFLYAEETDWQARIRDAGWKIAFTPTAQATHLAGASGKDKPAKINHHFFDSLDLYEYKHHGVAGLMGLHVAMIIGSLLRIPVGLLSALLPARRSCAVAKVKLHAWLLKRQLTTWTTASDACAVVLK